MEKIMESRYQPKEFEDRIYQSWMAGDCFKAKVNWARQPYTIVLPPPNITGQLHMGHALDHTLQDVLIRWKRMQGFEALWLPGTDHASIATEVKVLEKIREEEGLSKEEIGRDGFLERAWAWKEVYGNRIVDQMKRLGNSCDWSRERFTMDAGCNKAVTEVFVKLYEKGLIYRGYRMINWCPDCKTSLSDAEVEFEEKNGAFYHIKYFLKDTDTYLEIATTRPETLLGDTGVAVNPDDPRYGQYVGKTVILPLVGREIPVVADHHVDIEFGTGALKVTPPTTPTTSKSASAMIWSTASSSTRMPPSAKTAASMPAWTVTRPARPLSRIWRRRGCWWPSSPTSTMSGSATGAAPWWSP